MFLHTTDPFSDFSGRQLNGKKPSFSLLSLPAAEAWVFYTQASSHGRPEGGAVAKGTYELQPTARPPRGCPVQGQVVTELLTSWVCTSGAHGPSLRFCDLPELLTERRKTVYSSGDSFIIKGHNLGAAKLESRVG